MDSEQAASAIPPARPSWRIILLRPAGFGAGFAIVAVLLLGTAIWWINRPKQWSDRAITAKPAELTMQQTGDELRFEFRYAFTNHTSSEYALPAQDMGALMRKLPKDGSFERMGGATWDGTIRIPPQQSVAVAFVMPYRFSDFNTSATELEPDAKLTEFAGRRLKEIDGLVFFDYASKYKIDMPKNWDALQKQASESKPAPATSALLPPDKGDMLDRVAACDMAENLFQKCSAAHVSLESSPWIKYGGWPEKLGELPKPPPGYTLDPSPQTCSIASEWRNYCKAKVK